MKLYPPNGGKDYIIPIPSKEKEMMEKGWTEKTVNNKPKEIKKQESK